MEGNFESCILTFSFVVSGRESNTVSKPIMLFLTEHNFIFYNTGALEIIVSFRRDM